MKLRVLQSPSNVCNIGWAFAQGLRARGHHAEVWNQGPSPNAFNLDRVFPAAREPADCERFLQAAFLEGFGVFHFHGFSIYQHRGVMKAFSDLPILKQHGKTVVFTFHGSDVRLKSVDIEDEWSFHRHADIPCNESFIREKLDRIREHADALTVCNVLNLAYVPDAVYVPKAIDLDLYPAPKPLRATRPVVIHATRRRETKGTRFILAAVEKLQAKRLNFEFRLVESASHVETIAQVYDADVVVEKVLSGDVGVMGLEAMAMGKVAVSRVRPEVYARHPDLPAVDANPNTICDVLESLIADARHRQAIGGRGPGYVRATHAPELAAVELERLYLKNG